MNRNEEYQDLLKELERVPAELDGTLDRAVKRRRRQVAIYRPLIGMAAAFAVFVLLVNGSESVAYACSQIPILRELAEAVTFSKSLSKAVENEYVQEMNLVQTDGDVTAEIEYLIVDQKSVVIFYKLYSDKYQEIYSRKQILSADGNEELQVAWVDQNWASNGELTYIRVDFEENVPNSMQFVMEIFADDNYEEKQCVANVGFLLEFNPEFTSVGKRIELNKTFEVDGQVLIIQDIEIYPTQMRINISEGENNSAWLQGLDFYIESGDEKFSAGVDGLVSTGSIKENKVVSYRAESIYFYNAEKLELVVTGAKWLDKSQEKSYLNLKTGENKGFPNNVKFIDTRNSEEGLQVWVEVEQPIDSGLYGIFSSYYDSEGNEFHFMPQGGRGVAERIEGEKEYVHQFGTISNYKEDEVWMDFVYTSNIKLEEPITVQIK